MEEKKSIMKQKERSKEDNIRITEIENSITEDIAKKEYEKLAKVMGDLDSEPNINMWRELRKAYPKKNKPIPTGIKNIKGKIKPR